MRNKLSGAPVFLLRLLLGYFTCLIILFHPLVVIDYDLPAAFLWFGLLPASQALAFFLPWPGKRNFLRSGLFFNLIIWFAYIVFVDRFGDLSLTAGLVAAGAHLSTLAIFCGKKWAFYLIPVEQLLFLYINVRLASLARGFEADQVNPLLTHALLIFSLTFFLAHGAAVFFVFFRESSGRLRRKEVLIFSLFSAGMLLFLLVPSKKIENLTNFTLLQNRAPLIPVENPDQDNFLSGSQSSGAVLKGVPGREWDRRLPRPSSGDGDFGSGQPEKQRAVAIVANPGRQTLLMAGDYYGRLEPVNGFVAGQNKLNSLKDLKLVTAWRNNREPPLPKSPVYSEVNALVITYLTERYLPFEPQEVWPTLRRREFFPFEYSYRFLARTPRLEKMLSAAATGSVDDSGKDAKSLSASEKKKKENSSEDSDIIVSSLDRFLPSEDQAPGQARAADAVFFETGLIEEHERFFKNYVDQIIPAQADYGEKLTAVLENFRTFKYRLGFSDDTRVASLIKFLQSTQAGDCTEFSNSLALLCRYAGIASRVVTGYLASPRMQQVNHKNGLNYYRAHIPALAEYAPEDLLMVTTAHLHSWTQVYVPGSGWADVDPTSYAIAPDPTMNLNLSPLYIPLLDKQEDSRNVWENFPWTVLIRALGLLGGLGFVIVYAKKGLGILRLKALARQKNRSGVDALYALLLISLAEAGRPTKKPWQSSREYAKKHSEIDQATDLYEILRYSRLPDDLSWKRFKAEIDQSRRLLELNRFKKRLAAFFSLKGLYYL